MINIKRTILIVLCIALAIVHNTIIANPVNADDTEKPKVTKEQCREAFNKLPLDDADSRRSYIIPNGDMSYITDNTILMCINEHWIVALSWDEVMDTTSYSCYNRTIFNLPLCGHEKRDRLVFDEFAPEHWNTKCVNAEVCSNANMQWNTNAYAYFNHDNRRHYIMSPIGAACVDAGYCHEEECNGPQCPDWWQGTVDKWLNCNEASNVYQCAKLDGKTYSEIILIYQNSYIIDFCLKNGYCKKNTGNSTVNCKNASKKIADDKAATAKCKQESQDAADGKTSINDLFKPTSNLPPAVQNMETCQDNSVDFGWIVCPGVNIISKAVDGIAGMVADSLKWTILSDSSSNHIIDVWQKLVAFADIILAIIFIVALYVYSLNTTGALGMYTIKSMMSRLVIVAIAMNISLYVCAALADVSNILGNGIYKLITAQMVTGKDGGLIAALGGIVGFLLSAIALLTLAILNFSAIASTAVIILAVLTMRQIALIGLVVISPVAIACYLLPNTEKWFKKWWNYYFKLLLVYPMFTAAWGASRLISNILSASKKSNIVIETVASVAPLLMIMPIFQMSGALMGKLAGLGRTAANKTGMSRFAKDRDTRRRKRISNNIQSRSINLQNKLNNSNSKFGRFAGSALGHLNGTKAAARQERAQTARDEAFNSTVSGINDSHTKAKINKAHDKIDNMSDAELTSIVTTGKATSAGSSVDQYEYSAAIEEADRRNLINENNYQQVFAQVQQNGSELDRKAVADSKYGQYVLGDKGKEDFIKQDKVWKKGNSMSNDELENAIDKSIQVNTGSLNETSWLNMDSHQRALIVDRGISRGNTTIIDNVEKVNRKAQKSVSVYGTQADKDQFNHTKKLIKNARDGVTYTPGDAFKDNKGNRF